MNLPCNCHETVWKNHKNQKCHERAMKPTWIWHIAKNEAEIRQKKTNRQPTPTFWITFPIDFGRLYPGKACMWKCHETAMKVTWIRNESDIAVKLTGKCHENDMKAPWIRDEFAMNLTLRLDGHFWDGFSCWFRFFQEKIIKIRRKKVPWKGHETYMNLTYCQKWSWN